MQQDRKGALQAAAKLILSTKSEGSVTGPDFSQAENTPKRRRASAPAKLSSATNAFLRSLFSPREKTPDRSNLLMHPTQGLVVPFRPGR